MKKLFGRTPVTPDGYFCRSSRQEVFSCKFCEISKNTFSYRTPPAAVSAFGIFKKLIVTLKYYYESRNHVDIMFAF